MPLPSDPSLESESNDFLEQLIMPREHAKEQIAPIFCSRAPTRDAVVLSAKLVARGKSYHQRGDLFSELFSASTLAE